MTGIKETKELIGAIIAIRDGVAAAKEDDGKVDFSDFAKFVPALITLPEAINGAEKIPSELGDLDAEEIAQLEQEFGKIVKDADYQQAFLGLLIAGSAIRRIVAKKA